MSMGTKSGLSPALLHDENSMVGALHLRFGWVSFIVLLMSVSSPGTSLVRAQSSRLYVELAPIRGATALSSYIDAQANYVVAAGSFLESASIARNYNAAAAEHEMRNSVLWVQTYFRKRELNREYRRREKTSRRDKIANRYEVAERRILEQSFNMIKVGPNRLVAVGNDAEGTKVWAFTVERVKSSTTHAQN